MPGDLNQLLFNEGYSLNFFHAVNLIEKVMGDHSQIGTGDSFFKEPVRFEVHNSIGFPPSDVAFILPYEKVRPGSEITFLSASMMPKWDGETTIQQLKENGGKIKIAATFLGLYGVSSPLPSYLTEPVTLQKQDYFSLKLFLDIFGHRIHSLYYQAWKKYRPQVSFRSKPPDTTTRLILSFTGLLPGIPAEQNQINNHFYQLPFSGLLLSRNKSAKSLEKLLAGYMGFPKVQVRQFIQRQVNIPKKLKLGNPDTKLGKSTRLGLTMQDCSSQIRIEIGPLKREEFETMVPGPNEESTAKLDEVKNLIENFIPDALDYVIRVILENNGPAPQLGTENSVLGRGMWLGMQPSEKILVDL